MHDMVWGPKSLIDRETSIASGFNRDYKITHFVNSMKYVFCFLKTFIAKLDIEKNMKTRTWLFSLAKTFFQNFNNQDLIFVTKANSVKKWNNRLCQWKWLEGYKPHCLFSLSFFLPTFWNRILLTCFRKHTRKNKRKKSWKYISRNELSVRLVVLVTGRVASVEKQKNRSLL